MQEISLADKPVSAEVFLKKEPKQNFNFDSHVPMIGNPAPLKSIKFQENLHIPPKADYFANDVDSKANNSISEMYKSQLKISHISKILSAGMLGLKKDRKLVPTRWSITAVDDILSKDILRKIRYYPEISDIMVFTSEYVGNHYEFLLLPSSFSFEVIEIKMSGSVWNPFSAENAIMKDEEGFFGRKTYAANVTGAYYVNRLALAEYLEKIKRQAACLVMRECRPEYYAPLGVGILREASRAAFRNIPEKFTSIEEAFNRIQGRLKLNNAVFRDNSWLLANYGKQKRLAEFF
jgi:hypothetical protein